MASRKREFPTIKKVPVADLVPYARNARTHSQRQVDKLAAAIREYGFLVPLVIDGQNNIIAGHGRVLAAQKIGLDFLPCVIADHLTDSQRRAYVLADNRLAEDAGWDTELLKIELGELSDAGFNLEFTGFELGEIDGLLIDPPESPEELDNIPPPPSKPITRRGDIWQLGSHRVMCGDSTEPEEVLQLMNGKVAELMHADPPYGMGKQKDGVEGDNQYREKLDAFQLLWWRTWRPVLSDRSSAYIWGNAPDLWRLWYVAGLQDTEEFELRNQIVWDKGGTPGMKSDLMTQYPIATEHALFFQFGKQFLGNVNSDQYWDGWEEVRGYLAEEGRAVKLTPSKLRSITGVQMFSHWFTKSQWTFIPEKHYQALQTEFPDNFRTAWADLAKIHRRQKLKYREHINGIYGGMRAYFDNAHSIMRDVWPFDRVAGEDRHGHATPKPVAMMERIMRSSLPAGALCVEPFGGSGSTLMGAEVSGRVCYTMEITPRYVDVIVKRWQQQTDKQATLDGNGKTFEEVAEEREVEIEDAGEEEASAPEEA